MNAVHVRKSMPINIRSGNWFNDIDNEGNVVDVAFHDEDFNVAVIKAAAKVSYLFPATIPAKYARMVHV
jgi:hypothetical protein